MGWFGGRDNTWPACGRGDFANCASVIICGITYDGGYQEYKVAPVEALAHMPESLDPAEAAPLMCAGITTFNALRRNGGMPSDLVAVEGIGGLGHLGIQFAKSWDTSSGNRARSRQCVRREEAGGSQIVLKNSFVAYICECVPSGSPLICTTTALAGNSGNLLRIEEFANECHRFRRAFFHQPMPGATDDRLLNIGRNVSHDHCLEWTKGFLSAYGQHGHRELHARENFIVLCILGKRSELSKSSPHSPWLRVSGGKEPLVASSGLPGSPVKSFQIRSK